MPSAKSRGVRATTARTCTGEGSPFHRSSAVCVWSTAPVDVNRAVRGFEPRVCDHTRLGGLHRLVCRRLERLWRSSRLLDGSRRLTFRGPLDRASLGGLASLPRGRGRAPHRSGRDVSFLFQSQRSPAPDLRPVTRPNGWGDFPRERCASRRDGQRGGTTRRRVAPSHGDRAVAGTVIAAAGLSLPVRSRVGSRISPAVGSLVSSNRMEAL